MNHKIPPHRSSLGVEANLLCMLLFLSLLLFDKVLFAGIWVLPLLMYLFEKQSEYVKKMSLQAAVLGFASDVLTSVLSGISEFISGLAMGATLWNNGWALSGYSHLGSLLRNIFSGGFLRVLPAAAFGLLSAAISIGALVFIVLGAIRSYQYQDYEIPLVYQASQWLDQKFHHGKASF